MLPTSGEAAASCSSSTPAVPMQKICADCTRLNGWQHEAVDCGYIYVDVVVLSWDSIKLVGWVLGTAESLVQLR
jgi:hypothetical protein